jgi:hypothetical protein
MIYLYFTFLDLLKKEIKERSTENRRMESLHATLVPPLVTMGLKDLSQNNS